MGAVGGQFKQVAANYANAARGAAIDQAMKAGRQPYLPMTDLGMMATADKSLNVYTAGDFTNKQKQIMNDPSLSESEKALRLKNLDSEYAVTQDADTNMDPTGEYEKKLNNTADSFRLMNGLSSKVDDETAQFTDKYLENTKKSFGTSVPGSNGDYSDSKKLVDVKINNTGIGNARTSGGRVTGNMDDIVAGFGGKVAWDKTGMNAKVYDADGKVVANIARNGDTAYELDDKGNVVKTYSSVDGALQADFADYAKKMGVPISYFHDKNGTLHTYAQTDMKDAPIQVVRKDDQVYINAYIKFSGNPKDAQLALKSIMDTWGKDKKYRINGRALDGDNTDDEYVTLHTKIYTIDDNGRGVGGFDIPCDSVPHGHKTVTINLDKDSNLSRLFGLTSHVFTVDPKDIGSAFGVTIPRKGGMQNQNPIDTIGNLAYNLADAMSTKEKEKLLYNWSIKNPGQMWLYNPENDAAHEFAHLLGLGDAYAAFYRDNKDSPEFITRKNIYGQDESFYVPKEHKDPNNKVFDTQGDLLRGYKTLSDTDVALLLNAWMNNQAQYFDK